MLVLDDLTSRIRGEYVEMPGLRLTFAQACRLWQMDAPTCGAVLQTLLAQHFLQQTSDGSYVAFEVPRPMPAKATLSSGPSAQAAALRRA